MIICITIDLQFKPANLLPNGLFTRVHCDSRAPTFSFEVPELVHLNPNFPPPGAAPFTLLISQQAKNRKPESAFLISPLFHSFICQNAVFVTPRPSHPRHRRSFQCPRRSFHYCSSRRPTAYEQRCRPSRSRCSSQPSRGKIRIDTQRGQRE